MLHLLQLMSWYMLCCRFVFEDLGLNCMRGNWLALLRVARSGVNLIQ
jgi:hypothetical protein